MIKNTKPLVMLHYSGYGIQRSPNLQFDILRNTSELNERFEFITLNQAENPSTHGHVKTIIELYKEIKLHSPYAVHIIGVKEGFHCTVAAWLAGCKKRILVTHGFAGVSIKNSFIRRFIFQHIVEPITLLLSTDVQCNSNFSYNQDIIVKYASNKRYVIYNFLSLPDDDQLKRIDLKERYHISADDYVVVTIGNMHIGKGYDVLTKVIAATKNMSHIKYIVIGNGDYRKTFESDNQEYINSGKLVSLGEMPHESTMSLLSQSDLFFLPTRYETLGMVFAEAGFYGIPSIGTDVGAVKEIIDNKVTGYIIPQDDAEKAVQLIIELYNNKERGKKMGQNAKKKVRSVFDRDRIIQQLLEHYR